MKKSFISIIEDHPGTMQDLTQLIGSCNEPEIVALHSSAISFLEDGVTCTADSMHLLLLDIGLPGLSGIEAIPLILAKYPFLTIVILSGYEEADTILDAIRAGACSYISKKSDAEGILTGIQIVVNGGAYLSPSVAREIVHFLAARPKNQPIALSTRQKEILFKLADGKSYGSIASELFLSVETIRTHVKQMYKTMQVSNKTEAIARYFRVQIK